MKRAYLIVIIGLILPSLSLSATIRIPGDYPTIQSAITVSQSGDLLLVAPGTYNENISFQGKAIVLKSEQGSEVTHIAGDQTANVVTFNLGEDPWTVIEGFTITNGNRGILCEDASPTIRKNTITGNVCGEGGAGILCSNSSAVISQNIISENSAHLDGGGIECRLNAKPLIKYNIIRNNSCRLYGAGIECDSSLPEIVNNLIYGNINEGFDGAGIDIYGGYRPVIMNNTIYGNTCLAGSGGGINVDNAGAEVINTILWNNEATRGPEINLWNTPCLLFVRYSDVEGGLDSIYAAPGATFDWGPGNIDDDPVFVDPVRDDFQLDRLSPCINRGTDDDAPPDDIDLEARPFMGTTDMGADEFTGTHVLGVDHFEIYLNTGGAVQFFLNGDMPNIYRKYLLLGGFTGTAPGMPLPGGMKTLPLNWDAATDILLALLNTPFCQDFYGNLNAIGMATAKLDTLAPAPGVAGIELNFAFCLNNPFDFVSNPVYIELIP